MHAFQQGSPGLTLLVTFGYELPWLESAEGTRPLAECRSGLLAPFLDGLVEGSGAGRVVDGYELSYGLRETAAFSAVYAAMHGRILPAMAGAGVHRQPLSLGFGLWLDYDWRRRGWSAASPAQNYFSPEALERSLVAALQQTDEYVWLYSENPLWWTPEGGPRGLPNAYIEAVRRARLRAGLD
jgi:hypothetical protein